MPNIIGLGLDATDIDRIADTIERYGERFLRRIFSDGEIAYCTRRRVPAIHFAGRSSLLTITHSDDLAMAQVLLLGE
jgi:holo-[acyl-carrier-protein] synthase